MTAGCDAAKAKMAGRPKFAVSLSVCFPVFLLARTSFYCLSAFGQFLFFFADVVGSRLPCGVKVYNRATSNEGL